MLNIYKHTMKHISVKRSACLLKRKCVPHPSHSSFYRNNHWPISRGNQLQKRASRTSHVMAKALILSRNRLNYQSISDEWKIGVQRSSSFLIEACQRGIGNSVNRKIPSSKLILSDSSAKTHDSSDIDQISLSLSERPPSWSKIQSPP